MNEFIVYILRCGDNSLYTGYTNDLERRLKKHRAGKGAKYTRGRLPLKLVYQESYSTKGEALKREIEIKGFSKSKKEKLIKNWG